MQALPAAEDDALNASTTAAIQNQPLTNRQRVSNGALLLTRHSAHICNTQLVQRWAWRAHSYRERWGASQKAEFTARRV